MRLDATPDNFWLIRHVGATRTSLVTYLLPCTALIYGAIFLGESVSWYALVGLGLVLVGAVLTNGALDGLFRRRKSPSQTLPEAAQPAESVASTVAVGER